MIRNNNRYKLFYESSNEIPNIIKFELIRKDSLPFLNINRHSVDIQMKNFKKTRPVGSKKNVKQHQQKIQERNSMVEVSNNVNLPPLVKNSEVKQQKQKNQSSKKFYLKVLTQESVENKQNDYSLRKLKYQYLKQLRAMNIIKDKLKMHQLLSQAIQQSTQIQNKILEPKEYPYCLDF